MPWFITRTYIDDDTYLTHELARLAECAYVLPWSIVAHVASELIGNRHDRKAWAEKFEKKIVELYPAEKQHDNA